MGDEDLHKVIIVGDSQTGKTTFLKRLLHGIFHTQYKETIGFDFALKIYNLSGKTAGIQFWDIAGKELYGNMLPIYYKSAVAALIFYDVHNSDSLASVKKWMSTLEGLNIPICIVGNKNDDNGVIPIIVEDLCLAAGSNREIYCQTFSSKTYDQESASIWMEDMCRKMKITKSYNFDVHPKISQAVGKIMVFGDKGVGKTSFLKRVVGRNYNDTVEGEYLHVLKVLTLTNNNLVRLQFWDVSGLSDGREISKKTWDGYSEGACAAIIMYDINDIFSYRNVDLWLSIIDKYGKADGLRIPVVVMGTKGDMDNGCSYKYKNPGNRERLQVIERFSSKNYAPQNVDSFVMRIWNWANMELMKPKIEQMFDDEKYQSLLEDLRFISV